MEFNEDISNSEEIKNIPGQIQIKNHIYTKKDIFKKGVCYRCQNRAKCSLTIVLSFSEVKKLINNNVNEDIIYTANSKQQNHTCIVKEKVVVKPNDCLNIDELKKLAKILVKQNIDKDYNLHVENFHKNKIFWNSKKIRKFVNNIIQENYLKDDVFINNIINSTIKFNDFVNNIMFFN